MQVAWVSSARDRRVASYRYRVEAPAEGLRARGHVCETFNPDKADAYDVVVFSKAYSAEHRSFARALKRRGGRVVFDLCDNHFYNPYDLPKYRKARDEIGEMMSLADQVVCSTAALAAVVREETRNAVAPIVVGDIVERIRPQAAVGRHDGPLRLGWFGSHGSPNAPSGMTDLLLIREELEALAARYPVELTVCSNNRDKFEQAIAPLGLTTHYVEWSLESFPDFLAQTDAAVLPMSINPFTACKTHNRLTSALYAGLPVIASGIDSYQEFRPFCTLDDWSAGLGALVERTEDERERAASSRRMIDQRWTMQTLAAQWEAALALEAAARRESIRMQGRLDAIARGAVTGWVRAPVQSDLQLQVVLECDGDPVAVAVADRRREDLAGFGDTECGFSLMLPPGLIDRPHLNLRVRVLDSDWIVGENPILAKEAPAPGFAQAEAPVVDAAKTVVDAISRPLERWDVGADIRAQEAILVELTAAETSRVERRRKSALDILAGRRPPTPDEPPRDAFQDFSWTPSNAAH